MCWRPAVLNDRSGVVLKVLAASGERHLALSPVGAASAVAAGRPKAEPAERRRKATVVAAAPIPTTRNAVRGELSATRTPPNSSPIPGQRAVSASTAPIM